MKEVPKVWAYSLGDWLAHWRDAILWDPVAAFTVVLAISTVGLWLATRRLWIGAEAQAREFQRSVDAAEITAASTKRSVDLSMQLQQAFIDVTESGITPIDQPGPRRAVLTFRNTGPTPALMVTNWCGAGVFPYPFPEFDRMPEEFQMPSFTLGAGGASEKLVGFRELSREERQGVLSGNLGFVIWGEVAYDDIFGNHHIQSYRKVQGAGNEFHDGRLANM